MGFRPIDPSELDSEAASVSLISGTPRFRPIDPSELDTQPSTSDKVLSWIGNKGLSWIGNAANSAMFNKAPYLSAAVETPIEKAMGLMGLTEDRPMADIWSGNLQGGKDASSEMRDNLGLVGELSSGVTGGILNPINKLKAVQSVYQMGGPTGVLARAALGAGTNVASGEGAIGKDAAIGGGASLGIEALLGGGKGVYKLGKAFVSRPLTDEQALLQAFKVGANNVDDAAPGLKYLIDSEIITKPAGTTPYQDISRNLDNALSGKEKDVQSVLKTLPPLRTGDILPSPADFKGTLSGMEDRAINSSTTIEKNSLIKSALGKLFPDEPVSENVAAFRALEKKAASDPVAAKEFSKIATAIADVPVSANEVRNLRIKYDQAAKFNASTRGDKAQVYGALRDKLQSKIIEAAGGADSELGSTFKEYSKLFGAKDVIDKMAAVERTGALQPKSIGERALGTITKYTKSLGKNILGTVGEEPASPLEFLKKATGVKSFTEKTIDVVDKVVSSPKLRTAITTQLPKGEVSRSDTNYLDAIINKAEAKVSEKKLKAPEVLDATATPKPAKSLVEAVIKQESGGKATAVSNKGATGLMQLMPATAKEVAKELGVKDYDLKDPATNRKFGEHYLGKMLTMFDGDTKLALAAYNAGPGKVRQWVKQYGDNWDDISKELRSRGHYAETVNYVPSILRKIESIKV